MKNNIAIIGNGILGLGSAIEITRQDPTIKILIIGNSSRAGCASTAAGAMINHLGEVTSNTLNNHHDKTKLEISIEASKMWKQWLEEINDFSPVKYNPGTFVILNSKSGSLDTDNYLSIIKAAKIYNEIYEEVNPKDIPGINPLADCRPLRALYLPNEGSIDSNELISTLTLILLQNKNVEFIDSNVKKIDQTNNSLFQLTLKNEKRIEVEKVLLTAGSYTQHLIDQFPDISKKIPKILSGVGLSLVIEQDPNNIISNVIRTPNRSGACGLHALPRNNNNLYLGATNNISFLPQENQKVGLSQFLMQCAIDQINQNLYSSKITSWHVGNRPVTMDTFPLVGKTSIDNLYILTGTYRDGLQQSPFWAKHIANIMLNKDYYDKFNNIFKPERELLLPKCTTKESIKDVVEHYIAGFYEHDMHLARLFPEKKLENLLVKHFEEIYKQLDTELPFKPDILFLFELSDNNHESIAVIKKYLKSKISGALIN